VNNFEFDSVMISQSLRLSLVLGYSRTRGLFYLLKLAIALKNNNTTTEITGKRKITFYVQKNTYVDRIYINLKVDVNKAVYSS